MGAVQSARVCIALHSTTVRMVSGRMAMGMGESDGNGQDNSRPRRLVTRSGMAGMHGGIDVKVFWPMWLSIVTDSALWCGVVW